jgi:hypothetical protein
MRTRTADPEQTPDPMALDPLGPMGPEPDALELAGPLSLDPLSPMGWDATARGRQQQQEGTS